MREPAPRVFCPLFWVLRGEFEGLVKSERDRWAGRLAPPAWTAIGIRACERCETTRAGARTCRGRERGADA